MASYDLKAILGEKLKRLNDKTLKALVDCMCTVGASLCSLDKRVSALESVELPEGGYKPMQEPVVSPSASGTAIQFIDSISQDATGRMTSTKKTVRSASGSQSGVMSSAHYTKLNALYSKDELDDLFDGKQDKPSSATENNIATFNGSKSTKDSEKSFLTSTSTWDGTNENKIPTAKAVQAQLDGRVQTFTKGNELTDWNTLDDTGLYIVNTSNTVANEPERGKVACYVTNIGGYISQLAVGDKVYMRFKRALESSWHPWVVLQDSSGTTANKVYSSTMGGYLEIDGASFEASNSEGLTTIEGGGITTPKVNGIALGLLTDTAAAIPASANDKLNDVTHLLVNGNKTLKLSEMVENKAYVFHVVSSGAVVSVYNDSSSAYTIRHRGSNIPLALNSSASLNSSTDPAGEIWLARVGTNIYMSKSCEEGTVQNSLKWNGYSLSLGGTPMAGSGTIYFT